MSNVYKHKEGFFVELKEPINYIIGKFYILNQNKERIKKGIYFDLIICNFKNLKEL